MSHEWCQLEPDDPLVLEIVDRSIKLMRSAYPSFRRPVDIHDQLFWTETFGRWTIDIRQFDARKFDVRVGIYGTDPVGELMLSVGGEKLSVYRNGHLVAFSATMYSFFRAANLGGRSELCRELLPDLRQLLLLDDLGGCV